MAGPTPMALGPYQFQALGFSFEDQSKQLDTPWASLDVTDRFDALQWTGPKSDSFVIDGCIFPEEFGGQGSLEGIESAASSGRPLMLVTRAGRVGGLHVVENVSRDHQFIKGDGLPRKIGYSIQLKRYTPGGFGGVLGRLF